MNTAISVLAAIALLLPGFVVVELSLARGARSSRSDLELALRALTYALVIHLAALYWTADLISRIDEGEQWREHLGELLAYGLVVLIGAPVLAGTIINRAIGRTERRDGHPGLWLAALGAGEGRDAYDFAFQRVSGEGTYVIVELVGHTREAPRLVGGVYGRASAVGQTPAQHDIYLESLCTVVEREGFRHLDQTTNPPRGVWLSASQIARLEIVRRRLRLRHELRSSKAPTRRCAQRR